MTRPSRAPRRGRYRIDYDDGAPEMIERLAEADPIGGVLVIAAIQGLADDPRPEGVHVLSEGECLHRWRCDRVEPGTGRMLRYRILYRIDDDALVVAIVTAGAVPPPSQRDRRERRR